MPSVTFICDLHSHMCRSEIIGFLGGYWDDERQTLFVVRAFPCLSLDLHGEDTHVNVEMDPESAHRATTAIKNTGMSVVGWYHSHPTFQPDPSICDIQNQSQYQSLFTDSHKSNESDEKSANTTKKAPFVGIIVCPYDPNTKQKTSEMNMFRTTGFQPSGSRRNIVHLPMRVRARQLAYVSTQVATPNSSWNTIQSRLAWDHVYDKNMLKQQANKEQEVAAAAVVSVKEVTTTATKVTSPGYRGVVRTKEKGWAVYCIIAGKKHNLGIYEDIMDAAHAYDVGVKHLRGANVPKNVKSLSNLKEGEWEEYNLRKEVVHKAMFDILNKVVPYNEQLSWEIEEEKKKQLKEQQRQEFEKKRKEGKDNAAARLLAIQGKRVHKSITTEPRNSSSSSSKKKSKKKRSLACLDDKDSPSVRCTRSSAPSLSATGRPMREARTKQNHQEEIKGKKKKQQKVTGKNKKRITNMRKNEETKPELPRPFCCYDFCVKNGTKFGEISGKKITSRKSTTVFQVYACKTCKTQYVEARDGSKAYTSKKGVFSHLVMAALSTEDPTLYNSSLRSRTTVSLLLCRLHETKDSNELIRIFTMLNALVGTRGCLPVPTELEASNSIFLTTWSAGGADLISKLVLKKLNNCEPTNSAISTSLATSTYWTTLVSKAYGKLLRTMLYRQHSWYKEFDSATSSSSLSTNTSVASKINKNKRKLQNMISTDQEKFIMSAEQIQAKWSSEKKQRQAMAKKLVTTHGTNVSILVSEIVGLVEYYRVYRSRIIWEKEWKPNDGQTCRNKLLASVKRNASQLPLENSDQFAIDVVKYIESSWTRAIVKDRRTRKKLK